MIFAKLHCNTVATLRDDKMFVKISSHNPPTLPQNDLQGTWVFNDTLDFTAHGNVALSKIPLEFVSNDVNYVNMYIGAGTSNTTRRIIYTPSSGGTNVVAYVNSTFRDVAYQTIDISTTFDELSTNYENADLVLAFLQANATKQ